jgi:hypothetical protein
MTDDDEIECVAVEMIERFGAEAAHVARGLAARAESCRRASAQTWREIADAIERTRAGSTTQ